MPDEEQRAEEKIQKPDMGAVKYTCKKCLYSWEIEVSEEMLRARKQHVTYLSKPANHPWHTMSPEVLPDGTKLPLPLKRHDEFICKKCGEMRELTITQV